MTKKKKEIEQTIRDEGSIISNFTSYNIAKESKLIPIKIVITTSSTRLKRSVKYVDSVQSLYQ